MEAAFELTLRGSNSHPIPKLTCVVSPTPTSAPPARTHPSQDLGHTGKWVDGGVGANNPMLKATAEGMKLLVQRRESLYSGQRGASIDLPDKVVVVRVGNGVAAPRRLPRRWLQGAAAWGAFAPSLLMHATASASADLAESLQDGLREVNGNDELRRIVAVYEIEPPVSFRPTALDDASDEAIEQLYAAAKETTSASGTFHAAVDRVARAATCLP